MPPGFANKRNSCYVNSVLQCVFNIKILRDLCQKSCALHPEPCQCGEEGDILIVANRPGMAGTVPEI